LTVNVDEEFGLRMAEAMRAKCEAIARDAEALRGDSEYSMGASDMAREIADTIAALKVELMKS
jgi:hypothetical protein